MTPDDLDRLEALAAAARDHHAPDVWSSDLPPGGFVCGECGQPTESEPCAEHQGGQALLDALDPTADTVLRLIAAARLGAAWQAAEAALPEGWHLVLSSSRDAGHDAYARNPISSLSWEVAGNGPTPAAALLSLAEVLRGRGT